MLAGPSFRHSSRGRECGLLKGTLGRRLIAFSFSCAYTYSFTATWNNLKSCGWTLRSNDSRSFEYSNTVVLARLTGELLGKEISAIVPRLAGINGQLLGKHGAGWHELGSLLPSLSRSPR